MLPSLQQLRFLIALADELHFGRAAEACHVTQSTLSNGIKELEAILDVSLAERSKRSVLLTPVGIEIAERARRLLADATDLVDAAKRHSGVLRGELRLGAIPTVGPFLVPKVMPRVRKAFPDLRIYFREELTESLMAGLKAGRLDAIVFALPFEHEGLEMIELFDDDYQLATPLDHRLSNREVVTGSDLANEKLLLLEKGHCLQRHALSAFPDAHATQDDSFAATSLVTLVSMVEEGLGITLLPQLSIDAGVARGTRLALAPLKGACPRRIVLAWRKTSARAEEFAQLADIFRAARRDLFA
jgi:LysR family transcriptional regulator, hydrogen peroxide-inducible genes activator